MQDWGEEDHLEKGKASAGGAGGLGDSRFPELRRLGVSGLTYAQLGLEEQVEGGGCGGWGATVSGRGVGTTGWVCSGFRTVGIFPVHPREGAEGLALSQGKWECCLSNIGLGDIPRQLGVIPGGRRDRVEGEDCPLTSEVLWSPWQETGWRHWSHSPVSVGLHAFCQLSTSPRAGQQRGGLLCYVVFLHGLLVPWPVDPSSDGDHSPGISNGKLQMTHRKPKEGLFLNSDSQRCLDIHASAPAGRNTG